MESEVKKEARLEKWESVAIANTLNLIGFHKYIMMIH